MVLRKLFENYFTREYLLIILIYFNGVLSIFFHLSFELCKRSEDTGNIMSYIIQLLKKNIHFLPRNDDQSTSPEQEYTNRCIPAADIWCTLCTRHWCISSSRKGTQDIADLAYVKTCKKTLDVSKLLTCFDLYSSVLGVLWCVADLYGRRTYTS